MNCLNCGKEVKQTPGKRAKAYCDSNCRQRHWLKNNKKKATRGPGRPKKVVIDPEEIQKKIAEAKKKFKDMPVLRGPMKEVLPATSEIITEAVESEFDKMMREAKQEILNKRKK